MNVRGIIVNREVSISFYCQFVAGLVHFWNIYTGGTLYAAFSPVCDLFFSLWIYILRLRQSLENKYKLAYFTFSNVETKKKKRTLISYQWIMFPFQSKNGITAMASLARDTRLITADSAGLFYSHLYGFIGLFRIILLFETTANLNVRTCLPAPLSARTLLKRSQVIHHHFLLDPK